jgi:hypothetical protein
MSTPRAPSESEQEAGSAYACTEFAESLGIAENVLLLETPVRA